MRTRQSLNSTCSTRGQSPSILAMLTGSVTSHSVTWRIDVKFYTPRGHFMPTDSDRALLGGQHPRAACRFYAASQRLGGCKKKTLFNRCAQLSGVSSMWYARCSWAMSTRESTSSAARRLCCTLKI